MAFMGWWRQRSRKAKIWLIVGAVLAVFVIIGALAPSEEGGDNGGANPPPAAQPQPEPEPEPEPPAPEPPPPPPPPPPSNRADDDNEPHVGSNRPVVVDTLEWRVLGVTTADALGNEFARESADGVYVVVKLRVTNGKDESVTVSSGQMTYEVGGKKYETDGDGTSALSIGGDEETFLLKDLGPDVSTTGSVAFDVPPATLKQNPEVCLGEVGFGSTKGCIELPV